MNAEKGDRVLSDSLNNELKFFFLCIFHVVISIPVMSWCPHDYCPAHTYTLCVFLTGVLLWYRDLISGYLLFTWGNVDTLDTVRLGELPGDGVLSSTVSKQQNNQGIHGRTVCGTMGVWYGYSFPFRKKKSVWGKVEMGKGLELEKDKTKRERSHPFLKLLGGLCFETEL